MHYQTSRHTNLLAARDFGSVLDLMHAITSCIYIMSSGPAYRLMRKQKLYLSLHVIHSQDAIAFENQTRIGYIPTVICMA